VDPRALPRDRRARDAPSADRRGAAPQAAKRGGGWQRATLSGKHWVADFDVDELLTLNDALQELDPRQRQVVECRFFGGMEDSEIAEALGVTDRTVRRDWVKARAWLYRALAERGSRNALVQP
jgi:DNA-directed RNA polymerase specialized sigma24 family protein